MILQLSEQQGEAIKVLLDELSPMGSTIVIGDLLRMETRAHGSDLTHYLLRVVQAHIDHGKPLRLNTRYAESLAEHCFAEEDEDDALFRI